MLKVVRTTVLLGLTAALGACAPAVDNPLTTASGTGGTAFPTGGTVLETGGAVGVETGGSAPVATGGIVAPIGTGGMTPPPASSSSDLPCAVQEVLATHCWKCHGEKTEWGGPMSTVTHDDFQRMGKLTTTEVVSALVKARINDADRPMPPTTQDPMPDADRAILNAWLDGGAPAGDGSACNVTTPPPTGTGGDDGTDWAGVDTSWPGGVKPEETCYQFLKHGTQSPSDTSPHMVEMGETYVNFYYKVPWTEPMIATRWRTIYDNTQVLHHWLLYHASPAITPGQDGNWNNALGTHPGAQLVAGWAVGGGDEDFPEGVGLRMPPPGAMFELEWHLYNTTGAPAPDRSGIEVCVVPESAANPKYVAGLTWLGTEDLDIAPNSETKRGGTCTPSFKNGGPIHIVKWLPHMHLMGIQMDTWVMRADGTEELVFSEPFDFDRQISFDQNPPVIINQGDKLHAQCTFRNTLNKRIVFGQSTNDEMCYQFAIAYPAGSLDAGSLSWTGSDNTCMTFNVVK